MFSLPFDGRSMRSTRAILSVIACLSSLPAEAGEARQALLGRWKWSDERPGETVTAKVTSGQSFSRLAFLPSGKVVGFQYLAAVFHGGGEALESGYGRYRIRGRFLEVTPPDRDGSTGWPNRDGVYHSTYRCGYRMDATAAAFQLSNCPLSGTWIRDGDVPR